MLDYRLQITYGKDIKISFFVSELARPTGSIRDRNILFGLQAEETIRVIAKDLAAYIMGVWPIAKGPRQSNQYNLSFPFTFLYVLCLFSAMV